MLSTISDHFPTLKSLPTRCTAWRAAGPYSSPHAVKAPPRRGDGLVLENGVTSASTKPRGGMCTPHNVSGSTGGKLEALRPSGENCAASAGGKTVSLRSSGSMGDGATRVLTRCRMVSTSLRRVGVF